MGAATQVSQLFGGDTAVGWLGKALGARRQRLIGAEDHPPRKSGRHSTRFRVSQVTRNVRGIIDTGLSFDRAFIDNRWPYFKAKPSRRQDLATHIAARSEHQWLGAKPKRHESSCRVTPAFGQQSHDGSRCLLNRPPSDVDRWPIVLGA